MPNLHYEPFTFRLNFHKPMAFTVWLYVIIPFEDFCVRNKDDSTLITTDKAFDESLFVSPLIKPVSIYEEPVVSFFHQPCITNIQ